MTAQDPILLMAVAADGGILPLLVNFLPFIAIFVLFYFLLIRPQQKRMKAHQELVSSVKRGDTIVLSSGMIAKVSHLVRVVERLLEPQRERHRGRRHR